MFKQTHFKREIKTFDLQMNSSSGTSKLQNLQNTIPHGTSYQHLRHV